MMRRFFPLVLVLALMAVPAIAGSAIAQGNQVSVSAVDNVFQPKTITINAGDTVVWTNNGSVQHTVTADDGSFDSGLLNPGQTFSHTFDSPGTVLYHCTIHGAAGGIGMSGVITVQAVSAATAAPTAAPAPTEVPTETPTETPVATETPTETPVATEVPTAAATETPVATEVPTTVATETPVATEVPTQVPVASPPTAAPSPTPAPATATPVPTVVAIATATAVASPTPTAVPTPSGLPSAGEGDDFGPWLMLAAAGLLLAGGGLAARDLAQRR